MIVSIDAEKAFDKIQHPLLKLFKMGIERTYLSIVKVIYDKPAVNIILNGGKPKSIPPKIRNKTRVSTFTTIIQHSSGSSSYSNQRRKRNKRNPDQKRSSKALTVCRWHDPIHRKTKDSIRKLLELIRKFSKVAGYKINTQKSLAFLYTNNKKSQREIKESTLFTTATKRIKYLRINLPTETKELYIENY